MNRSLVGNIYGRSSIRVFISFRSINKHGRHRQFLLLIGWFLKFFFSETAWENDPKLDRKHLWVVLYKEYSFRSNYINNHGRHRRFLFLIGLFLKIFSLTHGQMNQNLVGSILERSSIQIVHPVPIHWQIWPPLAILVSDWFISQNLLRGPGDSMS